MTKDVGTDSSTPTPTIALKPGVPLNAERCPVYRRRGMDKEKTRTHSG